MKRWGGRGWMVGALALTLGANAVVLARVAANRSGAPTAQLELTQRELTLPWRAGDDGEDTGLALAIAWEGPRYEAGWLDRAKLAELGFDVADLRPRAEGEACRTPLPRDVLVVLEMEGEGWRGWLKAEEAELEELVTKVARGEATAKELERCRLRLARDRVEHTRLFAVDAGLDAGELRRRYPDEGRFALVPARVGVVLGSRKGDSPVSGRIEALAAPEVHVPLARRPVLDRALREERRRSAKTEGGSEGGPDEGETVAVRAPRPPLYRAVVFWGRRFEASLGEVAGLQPTEGGA